MAETRAQQPVPVAPGLDPALLGLRLPQETALFDRRALLLCALACAVAVAAALVAQLLTRLIGLVTNLAFYGRLSTDFTSPAGNHLGLFVLLVPVLGGLVVGAMARWGSAAIRGHGIPEAMEQVLRGQSRIPARITFLKPVSAAIAIGTGGPFGAEGPIIATGGALGSVLGQLLHTTADERKTLLAAGAAAGMTATFGSPVSAVLLAVELLLFELRPRSLVPVALACAVACGLRIAFVGSAPAFVMPELSQAPSSALAIYIALGALVGVASVLVTRATYAVEDAFEHLPLHWMWWPAIGAVAVGLCGYVAPRTLGVGYSNIDDILGGALAGRALALLCFFKFASWAISLGSGTSGGTLAPLFTIGGGLGALLGAGAAQLFPSAGLDPRLAALVGMAAMFAGASRALLASVVFAFETTRQPLGLLPLLGGCSAAFLISCLLMRNTIMTEKIARRGVRVPAEVAADFLEQVAASAAATRDVALLRAAQTVREVRDWFATHAPASRHQGFPVVDDDGLLVGLLTRRALTDPRTPPEATLRSLIARPPAVVFEDSSLREAADQMVREDVGRLPVVSRDEPRRVLGLLSRSDLLAAHARRLAERDDAATHLRVPFLHKARSTLRRARPC